MPSSSAPIIEPSSFRDPSGFVFSINENLYRQVNKCHASDYDLLIESGLYDELTQCGLLIRHIEESVDPPRPEISYKVIRPEKIPFISYPSEWCFSQLKAAALATLEIQRRCMTKGMSLKDCSAFNIQFRGYQPLLIDTLSIQRYDKNSPWIAYRQFCEHFLAPLALMSKIDPNFNKIYSFYLNGLPLEFTRKLLPFGSFFNLHLLIHIHLHSRFQNKYDLSLKKNNSRVTSSGLFAIVDSLEACISSLKFSSRNGFWNEYYGCNNYSLASLDEKKILVSNYLDFVKPKTVWDVGCNRGDFTQLASSKGAQVIAFDNDHASVEMLYLDIVGTQSSKILPLVIDLMSPTPSFGWSNTERGAFLRRGPVDTIMALAVVHHLVISGGVPLVEIAKLFCSLCTTLIIEFIPDTDSQVKRMLINRKDISSSYGIESFLHCFKKYFNIIKENKIDGTERTIFLMVSRNGEI